MSKSKKKIVGVKNSDRFRAEVKNTTDPSVTIDSILYNERNMVVDFSSASAFYSCSFGDFNNYLKDLSDFAQKFRELIVNVDKLSEHPIAELMRSAGFRHCHKTDMDELVREAVRVIYKENSLSELLCEQEIATDIYQIGFNGSVRLLGTVRGNVFRVQVIDYFHDIEPNEHRNIRNVKYYSYCAMKGNLDVKDDEWPGKINYSDLD